MQEELVNNFLERYMDYIILDTAHGRPSEDTKNTYRINIRLYLVWLKNKSVEPLQATSDDIKWYRQYLWNDKQYKVPTIALKLTAVRRFYEAALNRGFILANPAHRVYAGEDPEIDSLNRIHYLPADVVVKLLNIIPNSGEENLRAKAMIALMVIQGLRRVEIFRACMEDLDIKQRIMVVRGKRRNRITYPREDVMNVLRQYIKVRGTPIQHDKLGEPLFIAVSHNNLHGRISRDGIHGIVSEWFAKADIKDHGLSCHLLRHTCATLLLQATDNIRYVQEYMGHRDVNTTTRYAHVEEALLRKYAEAIPVKIM